MQVAREVVARHGKALTLEAQRAALGKRPLECWADVVQVPGEGPGRLCGWWGTSVSSLICVV